MKKLTLIFLIIISLGLNAQQMVRGYMASFSYGLLSKGDDFTIHYEGLDYLATATTTQGGCIALGFPFDFGYNRSRVVLTPGLDLMTSNYTLELDMDLPGLSGDTLRLSSFMVIPQLGLMYRYHFYVGKLHFSLGAGLDIKYPVTNSITLTDQAKTDLIEYAETPAEGVDYLEFSPNTVYSNLAGLGLHVNPRIGFDVHVTKYLVTNIFYTTSPLTTFSKEPILRGYAGFGATYLMPMGKEDDSRLLQYYKQ